MFIAAQFGEFPIVMQLIAAGANRNATSTEGNTALMWGKLYEAVQYR